jgi:hypothetical protein
VSERLVTQLVTSRERQRASDRHAARSRDFLDTLVTERSWRDDRSPVRLSRCLLFFARGLTRARSPRPR